MNPRQPEEKLQKCEEMQSISIWKKFYQNGSTMKVETNPVSVHFRAQKFRHHQQW